jgi:zinc protease
VRGRERARKRRQAVKAGARVEERQLENGMTVLLAERHSDPVVCVMLWYRCGARNEREDEAGVSHFLEHMMFKGSKSFGKGEVDRWTAELGGRNNAFTSYDHTGYWFELASDRWEKALEIEADRMRGLLLDPEEFAAERAVVVEELAMGLDEPWRRLGDLVSETLFERHPYRRPIIGYTDVLLAMSPQGMRDYYRRFYHPGNATLVVCGDFVPSSAMRLVKKHFASIPKGPDYAAADCFRPELADPVGEKRIRMSWDDQGRRMIAAWPGAPVGSDDDFALDLVSTVLAGGRSSRLHRLLVQDLGLATSVASHNDARVEAGVFWLMVEAAQGVEPERIEAEIDRELERLATDKVPARELGHVKAIIESSEAYEEETVSDLAEVLGEFAVDASWQLAIEAVERIKAVSSTAVRDVAQRLLRSERRVVGWCLPKQVAQVPRRVPARRSSRAKAARAGGGRR